METLTERDALKHRVEQLVSDIFPGSEIQWEDDSDIVRPGGTVVWDGFAGRSHVERQMELGAYLREKMGPEKRHLGMLFTLTPKELDFILQEA